MMCHGPLGLVLRLVEEALEENRGRRYDGAQQEYRSPGKETSIDAELAKMYAGGDIDRDTFLRLRPLVARGELSRSELDNLWREARLRPVPKPAPVDENTLALANIRQKKTALEQARRESETVVISLDQHIVGLKKEADSLHEQASEVLPKDEGRARALLMRRQEQLERSSALKERVDALRHDIQRLDDLEAELDVREKELTILQARERLTAIEEEIKGGNTE